MKNIFKPGDIKTHTYTVKPSDVAGFESGVVHPVCSTFALAREMEWVGRLFVLELKEEDEEGIGTMVHIEHKSPALVGNQLTLQATIHKLEKNELLCGVVVKCGDRVIAEGSTGQKVLPKQKISKIFSSLEEHGKR